TGTAPARRPFPLRREAAAGPSAERRGVDPADAVDRVLPALGGAVVAGGGIGVGRRPCADAIGHASLVGGDGDLGAIETERRDLVEHVGARPRVGEASALDEHGIDGNGRFAGFVAGRVGARLAALAGTALRRIGRRVARGRTRIERTRAPARLAGTRARFVGVACRRVFGGRCVAAAAGLPGRRGDVAAAPRAGPGGGATLRRGGGLGGVRIEAPARAYEEETEGAQRMIRHASEYATP